MSIVSKTRQYCVMFWGENVKRVFCCTHNKHSRQIFKIDTRRVTRFFHSEHCYRNSLFFSFPFKKSTPFISLHDGNYNSSSSSVELNEKSNPGFSVVVLFQCQEKSYIEDRKHALLFAIYANSILLSLGGILILNKNQTFSSRSTEEKLLKVTKAKN